MRLAIAAVLGCLLGLASIPARAATPACIGVDVGVDEAHHAIDITFRPPASVTRIALHSLAPYSRKALWQSPDGSAQIEDDAVIATPGHRVLHLRMDASQTPVRQDRAYAPFFRFVDGTIAIDTQQFLLAEGSAQTLCQRYVPAPGQQVIGFGQAGSQPLDLGRSSPNGYVAFGTPQVERHGQLWFVIDRGTPAKLRDRVVADVPRLVDFYVHRLGPANIPTLFLFMQPDEPGERSFHGDHLPSSITLSLQGPGWDALAENDWQSLSGFVAHELFHTWNGATLLGSPEGEALLAKEGGAELARVMATAALSQQTPAQWLPQIVSMYNACLFQQPAKQSIGDALDKRAPGGLPYDCGAPLMLALAVAADPKDPVGAYFGLWNALAARHRAAPAPDYAWTDLIPPSMDASMRASLLRAVHTPQGYAEGMQAVFAQLGLHLAPATRLDADDSRRYAGALMAHLMRVDCAGSVSLWTQPDGFLLDKSLPSCHVLKVGQTVDALLGQPLATADLLQLSRQMAELCARGATVKVGYKAEQGHALPDGEVPCTQALPPLPQPVVFAGFDGAAPLARETAPAGSSPTIAR